MIEISSFDIWKQNVIVFLAIPVIVLGSIYIQYGELMDAVMADQNLPPSRIIELKVQEEIFDNEYAPEDIMSPLPNVVRAIGSSAIQLVYILLLFWLIFFSLASYKKLAYRIGFKFLIFLELLLLFGIFIFSVSPGLEVALTIVGYLVFTILLLILVFYWLEGLKNNR